MRRIVLLMLFVLVSGCATPKLKQGDGGIVDRPQQPKDLDRATAMLESGDRAGAVKVLAVVSNSSGVAGVTDEALFRLALLSMRPATEKEGNQQALQLLKRLKKEYPASRWTVLSGPLAELLAGVEDLPRQNRKLKNHNQSLSNEVNELHRNIKKLKRLDQELEKERR